MNKILRLTPIFVLLLSSCNLSNSGNSSNSDGTDTSSVNSNGTVFEDYYESVEEAHNWTDERDYEYQNYLEKPSTVVSNIDELEAIVDYYAFYKIKKFSVTLDNYVYSTPYATIESELNYLYWHSELVNGVMGFNAEWINSKQWEFTYIFYRNAYKDSTPFFEKWTDLTYSEPISDRLDDYDSFATDDNDKPVCDVATTQQLWYAAEHGYRINALPNTPAEEYYNKSKELLRKIVSDSDSDLEKYSKIYDYIHENTTYDYASAYMSQDASNPKLYPDEFCSGDKCYYIEGFFDNGLVVCDGFSKIYTLLGRMEGLDIVRASGTDDTRWETREVPGHAYCFLNYNGEYFLSDLTWGQYQTYDDRRSCNYQRYFLAPHSYISPYCSTEWQDLHVKESFDDAKYFEVIGSTFEKYKVVTKNYTYSCLMTSEDVGTFYLPVLFSLLSGKTKSYINFYALGDEAINAAVSYCESSGYQCLYSYDRGFSNIGCEFLVMKR